MTSVYLQLMEEAETLRDHFGTEWAETHIGRYYKLEDRIVDHFLCKDITGKQAMDLYETACIDYEPWYFEG